MNRGLTYADAATLMGGGSSALVRALDSALGGLLLIATAGTSELAISLFDAKSELTRLSENLARSLGQRREGLGRLDRSKRMAAAHTVIVMTAFFAAVRDADLPFRPEVLRLGRRDEVAVASGADAPSNTLAAVAEQLRNSEIPPLSPAMTIDGTARELGRFYRTLGGRLRDYVSGLVAWDEMSETERQRTEGRLADEIPADAVGRWETLFRQLATDFPELAFYVDRADHEATRRELGQVATGLAALQERLHSTSDPITDGIREALVRGYRAELGRAIVESGDVPAYLEIPTLHEGYIDPDYRVASVSSADQIHTEGFWGTRPVHDDLAAFLVAYLSSVEAAERPLLLLGQPGAGKSVLTKFIAGRLPAQDFLVVRVVLRQAPADADVQTQIEDAVRRATGEQVRWPGLSRTAGAALRLVILDGFDELLQSIGVGQSSYLREVAAFQEREADQERPVAVIVTSRVAVADRAKLPTAGAAAVRLEPFRDRQIERWLRIWNGRNAVCLARRDMQQLPLPAVLAHRALAEQPLLLLMLALYDADANDLQREAGTLSTPDLYERLLGRFARREVAKNDPECSDGETEAAVQDELHRLSIAAIAMFHRGRQWVTHAELDVDLHGLLNEPAKQRDDFRAPVTPGAHTIGRFFFVHRVRSERAGQEFTAIEFLHATFGEYLVARLVMNEVATLLAVAELDLAGARAPQINPDLLLDVLAFTPLTLRATVIETLAARLGELAPPRRDRLRGVLVSLFRSVATGAAGVRTGNYRPIPQTPAGRQAMQSLNLLVLAALAGDGVTAREIFGVEAEIPETWRSTAMLWYAECSEEGWRTLIQTVRITRLGDRRDRDLLINVPPSAWSPESIDPLWFARFLDYKGYVPPFGWGHGNMDELKRTGTFLRDQPFNDLLHAVDVFPYSATPGLNTSFAAVPADGAVSAMHALLEVWVASAEREHERLVNAYDACLVVARYAFAPDNWCDRRLFLMLLLRQAAADKSDLPEPLLRRISELCDALVRVNVIPQDIPPEFRYWAEQVVPEGTLPPDRQP